MYKYKETVLNKDFLNELYVKSEPFFSKELHNFEHAERCRAYAFGLMRHIGFNEFCKEIEIAAFLHDIGRVNDCYDPFHGLNGAKICLEVLKEFKQENLNLDIISECIKYHCDNITGPNLNCSIVRDVDKIDRMRFGHVVSDNFLELKESFEMMPNFINIFIDSVKDKVKKLFSLTFNYENISLLYELLSSGSAKLVISQNQENKYIPVFKEIMRPFSQMDILKNISLLSQSRLLDNFPRLRKGYKLIDRYKTSSAKLASIEFPKIIIYEGAGFSQISGLPTHKELMEELGIYPKVEFSAIETHEKRLQLLQKFIKICDKFLKAEPHPIHIKLVNFIGKQSLFVTENFDQLIQKSGANTLYATEFVERCPREVIENNIEGLLILGLGRDERNIIQWLRSHNSNLKVVICNKEKINYLMKNDIFFKMNLIDLPDVFPEISKIFKLKESNL